MPEVSHLQTVKCRVYSVESRMLDKFIEIEVDSLKKSNLIDKQKNLSRISKTFVIDSIVVSFVFQLSGQLESFSINHGNKDLKYSAIHNQVQDSYTENYEFEFDTISQSHDSIEFLVQSPENFAWQEIRIPIRINLPLKVITNYSLNDLENLLLRNILFQEEMIFAREIKYGYPKTAFSMHFFETIEINFDNVSLLKKIIEDPTTGNCKKLINEIKWH